MIKSSLIEKIGLLDNNFFVYFEDVDWSIKITLNKLNLLIVPKSIIYHHEGASWNSKKKTFQGYISPFTHYLNIRNHIYLIRKHSNIFNLFGSTLFQIFKILSYSFYFIIRLRFTKLKMVFNGLIDSFKIKI